MMLLIGVSGLYPFRQQVRIMSAVQIWELKIMKDQGMIIIGFPTQEIQITQMVMTVRTVYFVRLEAVVIILYF